MRNFLSLFLALLSVTNLAAAESGLKRYLYLSTPDGAQEGGSGKGILIFDIDDGHRFVRRIDIPFKEGLRGFCGNAKRHAVYYTTTNRRLGAFDLESEKVLWERTYDLGCDRACITPDGKKLYVPTGWWWKGTNTGFLVVNPDNGDLIKRLPAGAAAHNSIASLDGQFAYLGTETNLWIFRTSDDSLVRNINNVGESGVFPFTVDSRNRYAYVCLGKHVGFDVVDLQTGKVPHRVLAGAEPIPHRTHGAALTPDEKELWISDQEGKKLFCFDATQMPPKETGHVDLTQGGHGWVTFSLDGRYAWCHTPDVIDARTRKIVATLKDENGKPVCGSKFIEIHFRNGKVMNMGDQFGLGRESLKLSAR
jgi:outer membrane protein assembly factor BamB